MSSPKYQRCTYCDWRGEVGTVFEQDCPKCLGFLILKSTQQSPRKKRQPNPKYQRKVNKERIDEGYRLHRDPKGKGWSFIEGKSPKDAPVFLSGEDAKKINSCAVRRGLIKSRRWM